MTKTVKGVAFKHAIGVLVLLALMFALSFAEFENAFLVGLAFFLEFNLPLLVFVAVTHFLADLFELFSLPFNLLSAFFKAFAFTASAIFLSNLVQAAVSAYSLVLALELTSLAVHFYRAVFVIALIASFYSLYKERKK
jgi:hypothetical protein